MIEKKKFKRDYINTQTRYTETNNNSANILNITFMPELFTAGKNLFRFKPNSMFISKTFPINIEILDLNGNPIYHEVLRKKERDNLSDNYIRQNLASNLCQSGYSLDRKSVSQEHIDVLRQIILIKREFRNAN